MISIMNNTVVHTNDDAQAWGKNLLGESNNTTTNNLTDKA